MQLLFENKIVSREQIGNRFFPNVCKDTVNRRLSKLVDLGLLRRKRAFEGRLAIVRCLLKAQIISRRCSERESEQYKKSYERSEYQLHDIALNDIRQAFEAKATVQGYYPENVLQTRTDFKNNEWLKPFVDLNSDAMIEVDSKVGTLNLAIEFEATHKSHRSYRRKLNAYYRFAHEACWPLSRSHKIDGVLYVCVSKYILHTLLKLDAETAERHACQSKFYFAMFNDVTEAKKEMTFKNTHGDIFRVH